MFQQAVHGSQQECRGLAGACLGLTGDVVARQGPGQRARLDGCAELETGRPHALLQWLG